MAMKIWIGILQCSELEIFPNFNANMIDRNPLMTGRHSNVIVTLQGTVICGLSLLLLSHATELRRLR